jgi:hypothetical protein
LHPLLRTFGSIVLLLKMIAEGPIIEEVRHPQHDILGSSNTAKEILMYDLRTFAGWLVLIISIVLVPSNQPAAAAAKCLDHGIVSFDEMRRHPECLLRPIAID